MAGRAAADFDVVVIGSGFGGSVAALRLTEKGYRVAVLEAGRRFRPRGLPADELGPAQLPVGPSARDARHPADLVAAQRRRALGRGRRRRLARLREHALPAARCVLPRPAVAAHHRLAGRACAVLRPGRSACSASLRARADAVGRRHAGRRGEDGRRGHVRYATRWGCTSASTGRRGRRPVLRRRGPRRDRLHFAAANA